MKRLSHIILRRVLVIMPLLLTLTLVMGQDGNIVYQGQTSELSVVPVAGETYYWELYTDDDITVDFAVVPGNCPDTDAYFVDGNTGASVDVMWLTPGNYFYKVTATNANGCSNLKVGIMTVLEGYSTAEFLEPLPICEGDPAFLTVVITGGIGPWSITYTDGFNTWTINDIQESPHTFEVIPSPVITTDFWITSVTNGYGLTEDTPSDPVTLIVYPTPVTSPIYRYGP